MPKLLIEIDVDPDKAAPDATVRMQTITSNQVHLPDAPALTILGNIVAPEPSASTICIWVNAAIREAFNLDPIDV